MLIDLKELSAVKKTVQVEVPADHVERELDRVTGEFGKQARIPGFRPGKTPLPVIRKRFDKEIRDETVQRLVPRYFYEAVSEKGLTAVGSPHLLNVGEILAGAPLRFEAEFEVKPEFELREYKGIELERPPVEITDKEVDGMIDSLRERASTFRPVEDRPAQDGDFVVMNVETSGEGVEKHTNEGSFVQLGEESPLPELHEVLRGKRPGDRVSFDKSYDPDAANEELRGKTVHYEIEIKDLRMREMPAADDEFAKSVGLDSMEAMRAKVAEDLKHHREHEAEQKMRQEAAEKLTAMYHFEVPETLVEEELGNALRSYARFLASQQIDLERANLDWEKMREDFRPEAEKRARRGLVLEEIARKEALTVTDAEVDAMIRRESEGAKSEFAEVKHRLRHDGGYEALRQTMLEERALDLVVREASVQ